MQNEFKIECDELWDEHSETIGEDIGSLEDFAGKTVMTKSEYFKLTAKIYDKFYKGSLDLRLALEKIIEMNYQTAEAQYGDRSKADGWGCVVIAKNALNK